MPVFIDKDGTQQEVTLDVNLYQRAKAAGLSVAQYINRQYPTASEENSTFEQFCLSSGLIVKPNAEFGLRSPVLGDIFDGTAQVNMGTVVREADPASRILFPAVVLEAVENQLVKNYELDAMSFDRMVGIRTSVTSNRVEYPVLNYQRVEQARSQVISQLDEPPNMLTITASDKARSIHTFSLGMKVADQALQVTTMDLVTMAVTRQARVEREAKAYEYLLAMLQGDPDMGQSALPQTKANTLDPTITSAGVVTKKALVKWLLTNYHKRAIDWIVCDIDTALAIDKALESTHTGNYFMDGFVPSFQLINRTLANLKVFIVQDGMGWPANTIMGLYSREAIHKITNAAATYSAVEQFVLRRAQALRFDFAEIAFRQVDEAFDVLSLTL